MRKNPSPIGINKEAGKSRRAMAPPTLLLVMTVIRVW